MSFNFLQTAKELFNNEIVSKASTFLGEKPANTQKAVDATIPIIGDALIDKSKTVSGSEIILNLIRDGNHSGNFLQNMLGMFDDNGSILNKGANAAKNLFGDKTSSIANAVSEYAGVKASSAYSLLAMITPVILGLLGKHSNEGNLNPSGFSAFMNNQKSKLAAFIPAGLGTYLSSFGLTDFQLNSSSSSNTTRPSVQNYASKPPAKKEANSTPGWLLPLIFGILLAAVLWYFFGMKGCNNNTTVTDTAQAVTPIVPDSSAPAIAKGTIDSVSGDYLYNVGKIIVINLPNGTVLNVGEFSTEAKLVNFLMDKDAMIDTVNGNWFEFTNVRFKTGGAEISDTSLQQLKNFVLIARAFPSAQFKIGGYTDNTGDSAMNVNLSQKRAEAVYSKTISLGAAKSSITGAKGYGPQYPIGDNTTIVGRAMNRRVAINVKAK